MSRIKFATKSILLLALLAALFSFAKFQHCVNTGFGAPDNYVHACYSDLSALYGARGLDHHQWPYSSATNSVEYPPLTGVIMWATALINPNVHSYNDYFYINAILLALLFIGSAYLLARMKPKFWYLLPLSPVVVAALFINWDMWAVLAALGSIALFDRRRFNWSAIILGIAIASKFYPIVLLAPVALVFLKRREITKLALYLLTTFISWLLINLPFALLTWDGWIRFFTLNKSRQADLGSFYYAMQLAYPSVHLPSINNLSIALFIILTALAAIYFYFLAPDSFLQTLAIPAFAFVAIFTTTSKVYSPQYVLWLTPLGILAMRSYKDRAPFWIWQGCEMLYHLAIWEYLAKYSGAKFGITGSSLALATFIRIIGTGYFALRIYWQRETQEIEAEPSALSEPEPLAL